MGDISALPRKVKVAIIGSGLAGLTTAYLLSNTVLEGGESVQFEVHMFEKAASLGMDSHSVSISSADEADEWRIDVPMRSFQGGCYPQLIKLYQKLGIQFARRDYTYSFTQLSESDRIASPNFLYNGHNGLRGISMPSSLKAATWIELVKVYTAFAFSALMILGAYLRLIYFCMPKNRPAGVTQMTLKDWVNHTMPRGLLTLLGADDAWMIFVASVIVPLFMAVCTAPVDDIWRHPVEELLDYIWSSMFESHYVAAEGVRKVVTALSVGISRVHVSSAITRLIPDPDKPSHVSLELNNGQIVDGFTHVIFATQANTAAQILRHHTYTISENDSPETARLRQTVSLLDTFRYVRNLVINHSDERVLPPDPSDRRELNLASWPYSTIEKAAATTASDLQVPRDFNMTTHILPLPASSTPVYQTTNPTIPISPATIRSIARMERVVLTTQSKAARSAFITMDGGLGSAQNVQITKDGPRIWFCGSYAGHGIPLLEGCVVSARAVVEQGIFASEGLKTWVNPW